MSAQHTYQQRAAGPYHEFWLCPEDLDPYEAYQTLLKESSSVRLSDAIVSYCYDSLTWIPAYNPAYRPMRRMQGLHMYGPSVITKEGADVFYQVVAAWQTTFSQGPRELLLSSGYCEIPLDNGEAYVRRPLQIIADRDELVTILSKLLGYAEQTKAGGSYILHLGI